MAKFFNHPKSTDITDPVHWKLKISVLSKDFGVFIYFNQYYEKIFCSSKT